MGLQKELNIGGKISWGGGCNIPENNSARMQTVPVHCTYNTGWQHDGCVPEIIKISLRTDISCVGVAWLMSLMARGYFMRDKVRLFTLHRT